MGGTFDGKKLSPPKGLGKVPGKTFPKTRKNWTIYGKNRKKSPPAAQKLRKNRRLRRSYIGWELSLFSENPGKVSKTFPKVPPI